MLDAKVLSDEFVLGTHVVVECTIWEWLDVGVRWTSRLTVPKRAVMTMKYFFRFKALSSPTSYLLSAIDLEYQDGYIIAGELESPKACMRYGRPELTIHTAVSNHRA